MAESVEKTEGPSTLGQQLLRLLEYIKRVVHQNGDPTELLPKIFNVSQEEIEKELKELEERGFIALNKPN